MRESVEVRLQRVRDAQREAEKGMDKPLSLVVTPLDDWDYPGMCPAQWEGTTAAGQEVYVKYRWGHLRVWVADVMVYARDFGKPGHGDMTREEMLEHTGIIVAM